MSNLTRSTFTFPKSSKPTERVKPMESSMNKNEQSPISAEDELKEKITKLTGEIHDLGFYSFEGEANYIRLNEIDAEICDLFEAYAQKKYQEGELKGRISELYGIITPIYGDKSWSEEDKYVLNLRGINIFERVKELESQLEKEEQ